MHRRDLLKSIAAAPLAALAAPAQQGSGTNGKPRFRPAICAYSFRNQLKDKSMSYADVIRMASDTGAEGVDLTTYWLPDPAGAALLALKRLAYRSAVQIYTIGIRARMAQPTPELQAAEVESVRKWCDAAEEVGASHIRIFGGPTPKEATENQTIAWAAETLKRCAEVSSEKGITLGLEDDGGIWTTAGPPLDVVKKAGSLWAGINLDTGNFRDDAYSQIEQCAPYATNVHLKTTVHMNGQSEPSDWPKILKLLGAAGYRGYLALEYESTDDPAGSVPKLVKKMRESIASYVVS